MGKRCGAGVEKRVHTMAELERRFAWKATMEYLLINLMGLVLAVSTGTEYYRWLHHFLRGWQDAGLGFVAFVSLVCLVLMLAHRRQRARLSLVARERASLCLQRTYPARSAIQRRAILYAHWPAAHRFIDSYNLPLQV